MNKKQWENYTHLQLTLNQLGVTGTEVDRLIRCERTLHRWSERECNGEIERDEVTGKPFGVRLSPYGVQWGLKAQARHTWPIPDREAGALKRVGEIAKAHGLTIYHQGDPRGCSLYILRPGDVREGEDVGAVYSRGIAVCY